MLFRERMCTCKKHADAVGPQAPSIVKWIHHNHHPKEEQSHLLFEESQTALPPCPAHNAESDQIFRFLHVQE